jgi:proline dehydrogenase
MKDHVPQYRFVQRAVKRFMPGETLDEALTSTQALAGQGLSTVLTYLGENVRTAEEAFTVRDHYLHVLESVHSRQYPTEISVKLTQLGLDVIGLETLAMLRELLRRAESLNSFVWIDMEGSSYVGQTLGLYTTLRSEFQNVGICLQSYLFRTADDLAALLPIRPSVRLVKGAYKEPRTIAFSRKSDVDRNYVELAGKLLSEPGPPLPRIAIATHDGAVITAIKDLARRNMVPSERFEFQMLYGIGRELQKVLRTQGYAVRVLISYGRAWYPWYMRRLAERPANLWFVAKNIWTS